MSITYSVAELYEYAMRPEHMESPDPSVGPSSITETGALAVSSGKRTGRVPKDKRIVCDAETKDVSHKAKTHNRDLVPEISVRPMVIFGYRK
jgi:ATP-dependent phosphoenolpyruvate carboxykinase